MVLCPFQLITCDCYVTVFCVCMCACVIYCIHTFLRAKKGFVRVSFGSDVSFCVYEYECALFFRIIFDGVILFFPTLLDRVEIAFHIPI